MTPTSKCCARARKTSVTDSKLPSSSPSAGAGTRMQRSSSATKRVKQKEKRVGMHQAQWLQDRHTVLTVCHHKAGAMINERGPLFM